MVKDTIDYEWFRNNINGTNERNGNVKAEKTQKQSAKKEAKPLGPRILEALEVSPMTCKEVAKQIAANSLATEKELKKLQKEDLVISTKKASGMMSVIYWGLKSKI